MAYISSNYKNRKIIKCSIPEVNDYKISSTNVTNMTSKFNNSDYDLNKSDYNKLNTSRMDGNNNSMEMKSKTNLDNSDIYHSPISTDATLSDSNSPWAELNNG